MGDAFEFWSAATAGQRKWTTAASDASSASATADGPALRFDFELQGNGAWAIARLDCALTLPAHYAVVLKVRGRMEPNQLQFKLVDPSGANVWWWRRTDFVAGAETTTVVLRRAALEFAWGPRSGGDPSEVRAVELALAIGKGGKGTLWIEDLRLEARDPEAAHPRVTAAGASSGDAAAAIDDGGGAWRPAAPDTKPWIQLDLGRVSEWGGVVVDFAGDGPTPASTLLASDDGGAWRVVARDEGGGRRRWLRTSDGEGRFARIEFAEGSGPVVAHAGILPLELAVSPSRYIGAIARRQRRGLYPRHLLGEQAYWAVVGADGDEKKGLLSEHGALEVDAEAFSIEPFLWVDDELVTWADADTTLGLEDDHLPLPWVEWSARGLTLRISAFAFGEAGKSTLACRYVLGGGGSGTREVRLLLAIRPFQVNPSWQSLNLVGGVAPISRIERGGDDVVVNGARRVTMPAAAEAFGVAASEEGPGSLVSGSPPSRQSIDDPIGFAEAVLAFDLVVGGDLRPSVAVALRQHDDAPPLPGGLDREAAAAWIDERYAETAESWRRRLAVVPIELPPVAKAFSDSMKASLAWVLVNREGPRIQPGPRCYRRSWIRDGTLTGTALAEVGFAEEPKAFLRWYAPYQYENGQVPCAVDRHGIDRVPEHDSHGQFLWGIVELWRLTGDRHLLEEMWPRMLRAADAIAALRAERTTDVYRGTGAYGLMPESISHEGYSSRPVHAYWDDFFAVRGLGDVADAADALGDEEAARGYRDLRDRMRADLHASIRHTLAAHRLDVLPGSVELGDFDPTSSAIALDPGDEGPRLPPAVLRNTFDRYWAEFEERRDGRTKAEAYTAYEIRNAPALVLLGEKARAVELLEWLVRDQRPPAWHQWPEVTTIDPRVARFLGDLPHGWIASSFVRTVRRMIAYERTDDGALVLGAGVPAAWVRDRPGVRVHGLPTHAGLLDFSVCAEGDDRVRVAIGGELGLPKGGIVVESPLDAPLTHVRVDGREEAVTDPRRVVLDRLATEVVLHYARPTPGVS